MNLITGITLCIALVGAVLGVINTVHSLNRDRIILRVIPEWTDESSNRLFLRVKVINLSHIAVSIEEIGFFLSRRRNSKKIPLTDIIPTDESPFSFPYMLQPKFSVPIIVSDEIIASKEFKDVKYAYARTSDGSTFKENSSALKQAVNEAKRKNNDTEVQKS